MQFPLMRFPLTQFKQDVCNDCATHQSLQPFILCFDLSQMSLAITRGPKVKFESHLRFGFGFLLIPKRLGMLNLKCLISSPFKFICRQHDLQLCKLLFAEIFLLIFMSHPLICFLKTLKKLFLTSRNCTCPKDFGIPAISYHLAVLKQQGSHPTFSTYFFLWHSYLSTISRLLVEPKALDVIIFSTLFKHYLKKPY